MEEYRPEILTVWTGGERSEDLSREMEDQCSDGTEQAWLMREITPLKMLRQDVTITDWKNIANLKRVILIGNRRQILTADVNQNRRERLFDEKEGEYFV